jgi:hypothetical protein
MLPRLRIILILKKKSCHMMNDAKTRTRSVFAGALIDQERARIIVPAQQPSTGFWFGGGNMAEDWEGNLYITGRYRNFGDSRSGTGMGDRGLELAMFRSGDRGATFSRVKSFSKKDLTIGSREVLSIEGSALNLKSLKSYNKALRYEGHIKCLQDFPLAA